MIVASHDFNFQVTGETIAATIDYSETILPPPSILSLHGGGPLGRQRVAPLATFLAKHGYPVLRFDHSGWGDSTGERQDCSLQSRVDEALAAAKLLQPETPMTLIGTSMGGHTALELLPHLPVKNLVLFCPAAYSADAFNVPFGNGFSGIIRQPDSYRNATVFANLENFTGNFIMIIGNHSASCYTFIRRISTELRA